MAQWLRLHASTAGGAGSIPGRGMKILNAVWRGHRGKKKKKERKKKMKKGNSLAVQWLGLGASTAGAQVRSLVGELRSRKPKKKKKEVFRRAERCAGLE